jgi:hypothetical protein
LWRSCAPTAAQQIAFWSMSHIRRGSRGPQTGPEPGPRWRARRRNVSDLRHSLPATTEAFRLEYGMLTDRLGRAFHRLELERQPRDVTPTLSEYFPPHGSPAVVCGAMPASWSATARTSTSRSSWSRTATRRTSAMSSTLWTYAVDTGVQNAMASRS